MLRTCVALEPSERLASATPIVAALKLALAEHATIKRTRRARRARRTTARRPRRGRRRRRRAPPGASVATTIALDDEEQADDLGCALRSSRGTTRRASTTKALEGYRALHGEDATLTTDVENQLSTLAFRQDDRRPPRRSTRSCSRPQGKDGPDPKVATKCTNLAGAREAQRVRRSTRGLRARCASSRSRNDERALARARRRARDDGSLHKTNGHLDGALEHFTRALELLEKLYGDQHPKYATCCKDVAEMLCFADDDAQLRNARERREGARRLPPHARQGPDSTVKFWCVLGLICSNEKQFGAAVVHFGRVLEYAEKDREHREQLYKRAHGGQLVNRARKLVHDAGGAQHDEAADVAMEAFALLDEINRPKAELDAACELRNGRGVTGRRFSHEPSKKVLLSGASFMDDGPSSEPRIPSQGPLGDS